MKSETMKCKQWSQHPKSVLSFGTRTQTPRWVVKSAWRGIAMTMMTMRIDDGDDDDGDDDG